MTAKKEDLVNAIQAELGDSITKKEAEQYLSAVLNGILATAKEHGAIRTTLGCFKWVNKPARKAFNPKSGEHVDVGAYDKLTFKTAPSIRQSASIPEVKPVAKKPAAKASAPVAAKTAAKPVAKKPTRAVKA